MEPLETREWVGPYIGDQANQWGRLRVCYSQAEGCQEGIPHEIAEEMVSASVAFSTLTEVRAGEQTKSDLLGDAGVLEGLEPIDDSEEETPSDLHALTETQCESV